MALINTQRYWLLSVLDTAIALLLTFPFACMYWRGVWDLIGYYVLPNHRPMNYWVHSCIGLLQMVGLMFLPLISKHLNPANRVKFWIFTRVFMYVHTLTYMFYWHGLWELLNEYFPLCWQYNLVTLAIAWLTLMLLGGCRSTMWPPFFIVCDTPELFQCANRFGSKPKRGVMLDYVSDAFVAQIVALGIAVLCWRSAFNLMDDLIYPTPNLDEQADEFNLKSNVITAVVGVVGCVLLLSLQIPLAFVSVALRWSPLLKVLYEDFVYLIVFGFLSLLWRGMWNLNAEYMIKELPLGGWVNHICGTAGLMAMQTFGEVSAFGMLRDGTDPGGEAFFPLQYLRHYLKGWYSQEDLDNKPQKADTSSFGFNEGYTNTAYMDTSMAIYPPFNHRGMPISQPTEVAHISFTEMHVDLHLHGAQGKGLLNQSSQADDWLNHRL